MLTERAKQRSNDYWQRLLPARDAFEANRKKAMISSNITCKNHATIFMDQCRTDCRDSGSYDNFDGTDMLKSCVSNITRTKTIYYANSKLCTKNKVLQHALLSVMGTVVCCKGCSWVFLVEAQI